MSNPTSSIPTSRDCSRGCGWARGCVARRSLPAPRSSSPSHWCCVLNHFAFPAHGVAGARLALFAALAGCGGALALRLPLHPPDARTCGAPTRKRQIRTWNSG